MAITTIQLKQDKNARGEAVPFRGSIWGYPYNDGSERDLSSFTLLQSGLPSTNFDAGNLVQGVGSNSPSQINPIRILQPRFGTIISAFLDINLTFSTADNGMGCYLAIGTFANAQTFSVNTSYSQDYLKQSWIKINGNVAYMTVSNGALKPQTLNILPALARFGESSFVSEGFVLLLCFDRQPTASGFKLNTLNIHMSVQGIK